MSSRSHRLIAVVLSAALAGCGGAQPAGEIIGTLADDGIRTTPQARSALRSTLQADTRLPPIAPQADAAVAPIMERAEAVVTLRQFTSTYGSDVVCASVELFQSASEPGSLTLDDYMSFLAQQGYGFTPSGHALAALESLGRLTQGDLAAIQQIWCALMSHE